MNVMRLNQNNYLVDLEEAASVVTDDRDPLRLSKYICPKSKLLELSKMGKKGKEIVEFYKEQNHQINVFLGLNEVDSFEDETDVIEYKIGMYGSLAANITLFTMQLLAGIFSGSLALLASTADAFMDLASQAVLIYSNHLASKQNYIKYPAGKAKYKTVGIIIFSTLMGTLSLQIITESIRSLVGSDHKVDVGWLSLSLVIVAIATKMILFIYCKLQNHLPSINLLAQDHLNDIMFNSTGIVTALLATYFYWWIDSVGAILIALLILKSWSGTAAEHIQLIVGKRAETTFLNQAVYISMTHDDRIIYVDTCRAYHSGNNVFCEVDIVLPPQMRLDESHDIGESLQNRLEELPDVDRAYVHLDYEIDHKPEHMKYK
ncbi:hypothetical protein HK103_002181 [Boothiomyces macroporosus]|uniref:Cation efflux protein cytoplasmic domain-containing protein n=1 Tax=Boothiomyces macroporosus TaxID=261099 RepID=A0AAD5UAI9_9FUNG|nr:hypothetical protein HK103_002181 [Boothiomyces macroporosus]